MPNDRLSALVGQSDAHNVVLNDIVGDRRAADAGVEPDAEARKGRDATVLKGEPIDDYDARTNARSLRVANN